MFLDEASQALRDISSLFRHGSDLRLNILINGTTAATAGTDYIFAGASASDKPTLQFIGSTNQTNAYSVGELIADGIGKSIYGSVDVGYRAQTEITGGVHISAGELDFSQAPGSVVTLDGDSSINNGGTLSDQAGAARSGTGMIVNGTITVGANGANHLELSSLGALDGTGTIRQTGTADVTTVSETGSGLHFDIRAGNLTISSPAGPFNGTIGPVNNIGPALGPNAEVTFFPASFNGAQAQANFDTSTGVLSLVAANGGADIHFSGDASGLNLSINGAALVITDHPGSVSPIPINFT